MLESGLAESRLVDSNRFNSYNRAVIILLTLRWIVGHLLRQPLLWLLLGVSALLWLTATAITPIGLGLGSRGITPFVYEVAFIGSLAGGTLAVAALGRLRWAFQQGGPISTLVLPPLGGFIGALAPIGLILVTILLFSGQSAVHPTALIGCGFLALHVGALAAVTLALPLQPTHASLLLPVLAWILPTLTLHASGFGGGLVRLLDVGQHLLPREEVIDRTQRLHDLVPIALLIIISLLLQPRPLMRFASTRHEVRNPR